MVQLCTLIKKGLTPEFEEGVSYILQNYTLSNTYGQMYLFVGPGTLKFKTVPQDISGEAHNAAKEALCPSSASVTGEENRTYFQGEATSASKGRSKQ